MLLFLKCGRHFSGFALVVARKEFIDFPRERRIHELFLTLSSNAPTFLFSYAEVSCYQSRGGGSASHEACSGEQYPDNCY